MRLTIAAVAAVLAAGLVAPTPSVAQQKSLQESFNGCVELAKQRGWATSDLEQNRSEVRNFVLSCMRGGKARAQAPSGKKKASKAR
jgi:hypothetical protein